MLATGNSAIILIHFLYVTMDSLPSNTMSYNAGNMFTAASEMLRRLLTSLGQLRRINVSQADYQIAYREGIAVNRLRPANDAIASRSWHDAGKE